MKTSSRAEHIIVTSLPSRKNHADRHVRISCLANPMSVAKLCQENIANKCLGAGSENVTLVTTLSLLTELNLERKMIF